MERPYDPWTGVTSRHGYAADELISALQKTIRRGDAETAVRVAYEMYQTSQALEDMLWDRLCVISVEDVGMGQPQAPVLIETLDRLRRRFAYGAVDRPLFFFQAIRYLCACPKTRASDLLKNVVEQEFARGVLPQIPDVALDMHTRRGQALGRGEAFFYQEASRVCPAAQIDEPDYRSQLMALLGLAEGGQPAPKQTAQTEKE